MRHIGEIPRKTPVEAKKEEPAKAATAPASAEPVQEDTFDESVVIN